ncbi:TraX family protein [Brevibacillus sp. NPDC058079]|uniref:TraX family protein n=1 Tax=Brevibacillus sp. NPDC058079 TaxID=3346330 RepID=UPI0036ED8E74
MRDSIGTKGSDFLKILAIISMVIDHIGGAFFPDIILFRIIGRLAFPIFAFQLAQGARYTSNSGKYALRLWGFALVSQIPYMILWDTTTLNILFVLLLSLAMIKTRIRNIGVFALIVFLFDFDYGFYGVLLAPLFYWFADRKHIACLLLSVATICYSWYTGAWIQLFAIVGIVFVLYVPHDWWKIRLNRYVYYWFYPVHLTTILIISLLIK